MFYPKRSLGQNFLIDSSVLPEIIKAAEIRDGDVVIEIGPGLGILTKALLDAGAKVFAIEKDFDLVAKLTQMFGNNKNLKIVHQDALFFDFSHFETFKVVSNLPFNIASPIIRKFLESSNPPELMVIMIQKEVAEKILAKPGNSERGILTLAVEFYGKAEMIAIVPKTSFRPQPKVDAAIIKIKPFQPHSRNGVRKVEPKFTACFFRIVKAGFSSKRRQIHNSLTATLRLEKNIVLDLLKKAQIDPQLRAEDLSLKQWLELSQVIKKNLR